MLCEYRSNFVIGSFLILLQLLPYSRTDSVCDLNTFIVEVKQDLADNGMLDCLRVIEPPHFVEETEEQKNLRLAAQWDTSCAFESNSNWQAMLRSKMGISNLVDSTGEIVKKDFEDQADLCEILRAAVAQNLFNIPDLNMQRIPYDIIDKIDCAGVADQKVGPRICAATGGSYFQKDSWTIFLDTPSIKVGGKPEFVHSDSTPETVANPYADQSDPQAQNTLIKDLMKFSRDQLDLKQGELANIIDRAENREKPTEQNTEKDNQKENSKEVHVHVKRINEASFTPNKNFLPVDGAVNKFTMKESRIVFGFYMASFKSSSNKPLNFFYKLNWANREMPETRQAIGDANLATLTSAFGEVYNPRKGEESLDLAVVYDTSSPSSVSTDSGEQNFSFGAITLPPGDVYKKINSGNLEFHKSERWNTLNNFDVTIKNTESSSNYYFVMYNLVFPLPGKFTLETRLRMGSYHIMETAVQCGPTTIIGSHAGAVVSVKPGSVPISLEYKYNGDSLELNDFTDAHYVQSMTAFALPKSTEVHNFKLDKPFPLLTNGEWKNFDLGASLELQTKKTVFFIYNINLKVDNANFAARLRIDTKYNRKSVFTTTGQSFANAQGYVVKVMKPGRYNFDIDFKSDAQNTFEPSNSELDGQIVSLQIVLFD